MLVALVGVRVWWAQAECAVWALCVVVLRMRSQSRHSERTVRTKCSATTLAFGAAYWRAQNPDSLAAEDLVEGEADRLLPEADRAVSTLATQYGYLQVFFNESDGTRTRDLRRDRPLRGTRRLATIAAQSLY